jgi:hypothetical protein
VRDLKAFIKTLEANTIKLDRPYPVNDSGIGIAFITDPWGTDIEYQRAASAIKRIVLSEATAVVPVKIGDPGGYDGAAQPNAWLLCSTCS